jgi:hypothetical protein
MAGSLWHLVWRGLARFRWPLAGLVALAIILACMLVIPQWLVRWDLGAQVRTLSAADKAKARTMYGWEALALVEERIRRENLHRLELLRLKAHAPL